MKTAIHDLDYTTFSLHDESFLLLMKKFRMAADHGYLSYNSLLSYEPEILQLHKSIIAAQEKILDVNRTTLYSIIPALDHMRLFLTDEAMGSVSLVSKQMNEMISSKYGISVKLYIVKYNLAAGNNVIPVKFFHNNQSVTLEMKNRIVMKRQLRALLGCEKYFRDLSNYEIFFMSDLKYVLEMFATKGICTRILVPKTICVICKEVKSIDNLHHECFDSYAKANNMVNIHNKTFNAIVSTRENAKRFSGSHPSFVGDESRGSNNDEDSDDYNEEESIHDSRILKGTSIDYEIKSLCNHYYGQRLFTCEYMYPELIFYFNKNNFFPAPRVLKSEIVACDLISRKKIIDSAGGKVCTKQCRNCCYFVSTECGVERKDFYTPLQHDKIWTCFRTNTLPLKTRNKCRGKYQIPTKCITDKISDLTPCNICTFPRFFHNINFDK